MAQQRTGNGRRLPAMILAGGGARRMGGGDKGLVLLGERPLLAHVVDRLAPQAGPLALNAGGDPARFAAFGLPVVPDPVDGQPGPLAGILAALEWAAGLDAPAVVTVPTDAPFLPADLVDRLSAGPGPAVAASGGRVHGTVGLWPVALAPALRAALAGGTRRVMDWAERTGAREVAFAGTEPDPFANLNTPEDVRAAAAWLAQDADR
ncbi:molybdenum cofactor guanylyltransferase MobA [Wenxinia marina]|uniref:Molybdenum cofactor guanylyltransferase n=1 Tax=Wenxinia marina DSM 24838 TaxID=1123501 RepID=A0A0D0NPZ3_9RHOB|nr:molybdenum cofactor guanylyltransferase MobA [Wenxinia marina]KIQ70340.1 molybdenum cofactor guanylyltransferase [Wenxinia marina DSM 24838]GGL53891.1 molybdenum cofactor guanylyltransferase [Wenxinia marina]